MNLTDILAQAGGLQSVARDLGLSEDQAAAGAEAMLPAMNGDGNALDDILRMAGKARG